MSTDSDSDCEQYQLQKYSIVQFVKRGRKKKTGNEVDIVPSKWITFDTSKGKNVTKYLAPPGKDLPYSEEDLQLIQELVINNVEAPEDWPTWTIQPVGRAKTYKEGLSKIKRLETEDHVLTMESEDSISDVRNKFTFAVKRQKLLEQASKFTENLSSLTSASQTAINLSVNASQHSITSENEEIEANPSMNVNLSDAALNDYNIDDADNKTDEVQNLTARKEHQPKAPEPNQHHSTLMDVPIFYNNVECNTPFEVAVMNRLDELCQEFRSLKLDVESLLKEQSATSNFLTGKALINKDTCTLETKHHLILPLATYQDFQELEAKLQTDKYFKKDVNNELKNFIDKEFGISRSIVKMSKRFLNKALAQQFTALRSSPTNKNKFKFRSTELCNLMEGAITTARREKDLNISQELFNASLTDVFTNIHKWKK